MLNLKTQKIIEESRFRIIGFSEDFFDSDGRMLASIPLDEVPEDREVLSEGEIKFVLQADRVFVRNNKRKRMRKGARITSRIDVLCGRLKQPLTNH